MTMLRYVVAFTEDGFLISSREPIDRSTSFHTHKKETPFRNQFEKRKRALSFLEKTIIHLVVLSIPKSLNPASVFLLFFLQLVRHCVNRVARQRNERKLPTIAAPQ